MKKLVSLLLALWLWGIPAGLLAEENEITWANFLAEAQAALNGVKEGEAVLVPSAPVLCYIEKTDKPLSVPKGKRLVIQDAQFEGFFLTNGEVELRSVRIVAVGNHGVAILSQRNKAVDIRLTIDTASTIEVSGERACAVGVIEPCYFGNDVSIFVNNAGTLRSADDAAIGLPADADGYRTSKVFVHNTGTVRGGTCGIGVSASAQRAAAHAEVINEGKVTGGGGSGSFPDITSETGGNRFGIFVNATSVRDVATAVVHNRAGGVVRSEQGGALGLYLYDGRNRAVYDGKKPNAKLIGIAEVINDAVLEGATGALHIETPFKAPVPVKLSGAGNWRSGAERPAVSIALYEYSEEKAPDEAAFMATVNAYFDAMGLAALEGGVRAITTLGRPTWRGSTEAPAYQVESAPAL